MGKVTTEKKACECCKKVKLIPTYAKFCHGCKYSGHDQVNPMIKNFCLGRSPLGV